MADSTPADPERTTEAYRLHVEERLSVRQVAARLGVSNTTAHRYITAGRAVAQPFVEVLNRTEERGWSHDLYRELEAMAHERLLKAEDEQAAVWWFDRVVKVLKERRDLAGLDAPKQLAVRNVKDLPTLRAAPEVREAARRAAQDVQGRDWRGEGERGAT